MRLRSDTRSKAYAEPHFAYLDYSARPAVERVRRLLEDWFERYPRSGAEELAARLKSPDDGQHDSAFFELCLHELLLRLGCALELHPITGASKGRVDFLAQPASGEKFFLEATLALESDEKRARDRRASLVYDALNRVESPNFRLSVDVQRGASAPISVQRLRAFLEPRLRALDPDQWTEDTTGRDFLDWPRWFYRDGDWLIEVVPLAKGPEFRGRAGRPVGMIGVEGGLIENVAMLEGAINRKAKRYGDLGAPFVIAVSSLSAFSFEHSEIVDALYGGEQPNSRLPTDCAWYGPQGPRNTRVTAALIATDLNPWTLRTAQVRLYRNPWANRPEVSVLSSLPQAIARDGEPIVYAEGRALADILDIPARWPDDSAL